MPGKEIFGLMEIGFFGYLLFDHFLHFNKESISRIFIK